jgi:hypothetical protein
MSRNPQPEIFIKTLGELLEDERESQRLRRRLQHRERAHRFVQAFWAKLDAGPLASQRSPRGSQTETETARHLRIE